jgi:hypothetical protein
MEKRIKIFRNDNWVNLEIIANEFLKKTVGKLHEVFMSPSIENNYILIVYTPEGEQNEEKITQSKEGEKSHGRIQGRITPLWEQGGPYCKV